MTQPVRLVEVGPRDGLQNEKGIVTTDQKVKLIHLLGEAGLTSIEAGAFVSPKWVPQMADSGTVFDQIEKRDHISYPVLTPNMKGLELALSHHVREIAIFAAASESFSKRNINCSIEESLLRFEQVCARAVGQGLRVRGYISCVLGCPYEGPVSHDLVADMTERLFSMGCFEVSLGDTIGTGTPHMTETLLKAVSAKAPLEKIAGHFHDTYGQAIANCWAAYRLGVRTFDASIAGLGGCPYAKGATGNVSTEDLVYSFEQSGIQTGIQMDALLKATRFVESMVGYPARSRAGRALLLKLDRLDPRPFGDK